MIALATAILTGLLLGGSVAYAFRGINRDDTAPHKRSHRGRDYAPKRYYRSWWRRMA